MLLLLLQIIHKKFTWKFSKCWAVHPTVPTKTPVDRDVGLQCWGSCCCCYCCWYLMINLWLYFFFALYFFGRDYSGTRGTGVSKRGRERERGTRVCGEKEEEGGQCAPGANGVGCWLLIVVFGISHFTFTITHSHKHSLTHSHSHTRIHKCFVCVFLVTAPNWHESTFIAQQQQQ